MESDDGFAAWMSTRQPRLLRTAFLLCGDPHTAEDLTQTALAKGRVLWRTGLAITGFSGDGRYVVAAAYGSDRTGVSLLDARTGAVVRTLRPARAGVHLLTAAWEDSRHVIVPVTVPGSQRQVLVRFGVDGTLRRATAVTSTEGGAFVLQRTP